MAITSLQQRQAKLILFVLHCIRNITHGASHFMHVMDAAIAPLLHCFHPIISRKTKATTETTTTTTAHPSLSCLLASNANNYCVIDFKVDLAFKQYYF